MGIVIFKTGNVKREVKEMKKTKKDPSRTRLGSPHVEGQGTTNTETGSKEVDSSRNKQRR